MTRNTAISVAGLHKTYGDNEVLKGVDLEVPEGSVYALLGPNGSGKTTVVNICSTLLTADAGEIRVAGYDVRRESDEVRRSIGVTGQFSAIDEFHTGRENLKLMADLNHLDRGRAKTVIEDLLERFELADAADRRAQTYSGGMKRRLDLAMTLIGSPRLIFLDEPTTGLDPRSRAAPAGTASKKSPPTASQRSACAARAAAPRPMTDGWSNRITRNPGCRDSSVASMEPLPPPTSTSSSTPPNG